MQTSDELVVLHAAQIKAVVSRKDSSVTFQDSSGKTLFQQTEVTMTPVVVNGESTYHVELFSKLWGSYESFYGLGQHQAGVWNYRGEAVDISQDNTNISIPFFLSSNGHGIFWNHASRSRFNNRFLGALYLSSEVADEMDYYFLYGPEFDRIIAGYRELTGAPPLFGKWAYGFWQCKNKYNTQEELLGVAHRYRELHIPVDNIVQDWFWWNTMGEPVFDKARYPDPPGMAEDLHKNNFHLMISVWPYFRPGSKTYDDMDRRGFFIDRTKVPSFHPPRMALYDAFNPQARKYYWNLMDEALFKIGVDAWWLDTTEPETEDRETNILETNKTYLGNGARYANAFPLMTTQGVYPGQRNDSYKLRYAALSLASIHLLTGLDDHEPRLHTDARIDYGFPHRCALGDHRRSIHVWSGISGEPSHRSSCKFPARLSAQSEVVRLLERQFCGWTAHDGRGRAYRKAAAVCARGFDFADGAGKGVGHGETRRPHRVAHLSRRGWRFHALRRRERRLQL